MKTVRKIMENSQRSNSRKPPGRGRIFCPDEKRLLQLLFIQPVLLLPLANELDSECFQGLP
jgi:hypothetical protein